jgi:hypothetical protein
MPRDASLADPLAMIGRTGPVPSAIPLKLSVCSWLPGDAGHDWPAVSAGNASRRINAVGTVPAMSLDAQMDPSLAHASR